MKTALIMLIAALALPAADKWTLPRNLEVKDDGPRTYRFTVDYIYADTKGAIDHRERISGEYTRAAAPGVARWNNVSAAKASGATAPFGPGEKRDFMEGFRYSTAEAADALKPEFFKNFPAMAFQEKNLVWDTLMFEGFGQTQFDKLELNKPHHWQQEDLDLAGMGTFQNRDVRLTWVGMSRRNGQDCAVILYRATFNPLGMDMAGMKMTGRSHYWGEIWVSTATKQIEYGTLNEDVLAELKLPNAANAQTVSVFREGVFEPLARR